MCSSRHNVNPGRTDYNVLKLFLNLSRALHCFCRVVEAEGRTRDL